MLPWLNTAKILSKVLLNAKNIGYLRIGELTLDYTANYVLQMSQVTFKNRKILFHFQNIKSMMVMVL